jgi:hypothetical protein
LDAPLAAEGGGVMANLFFDEANKAELTEEIDGKDLRVGDTMILLGEPNIIHHFEVYSGTLDFVNRIAKFTNGRGCSISDRFYKILKRM